MSYCKLPSFILGFHGCDESVKELLLLGKTKLKPSNNEYDWLGSGIYFWENDPDRALSYAKLLQNNPKRNKKNKIDKPAVVGAVIDLGNCLNLFEEKNLQLVHSAYDFLVRYSKEHQRPIPKNTLGNDLLLRNLDCAVINTLHELLKGINEYPNYDSVRAPFWEGKELYPQAGFKEKNHIQICVVNPNCIKGYFDPLNPDY